MVRKSKTQRAPHPLGCGLSSHLCLGFWRNPDVALKQRLRTKVRSFISPKSQFKIQQTSFMLIAVVLFFILVFLFWMSIKTKSLHSEATKLEEDKAVLMAQYISGMTELSCPDKQYCLDTDKLMILKDMASYKDFWPANGIKIRKIYPEEKDIECSINNYPDCNTYTIRASGNTSVGTFVALCRQERVNDYTKRVCELGRIAISYNIK